jgi:hypothetical protein
VHPYSVVGTDQSLKNNRGVFYYFRNSLGEGEWTERWLCGERRYIYRESQGLNPSIKSFTPNRDDVFSATVWGFGKTSHA